ncbi:hypothetical protein O6H91_09G069400 [Diphasiastrum complanatum]|uniref:Uncharacterized protein n=1 Tax=Diphasiastrum complanatum TaxID=34168 RepID=A0ACC2CQC4_DIPCM|nr:hypothetical protein O6H91_09G069400 [Diphasiastrum complanatum]
MGGLSFKLSTWQLMGMLKLCRLMLLLLLAQYYGGIRCNCLDSQNLLKTRVDESSPSLCSAFVSPYGYPCEEYTVLTKDGFFLGVQRISGGQASVHRNHSKPPVVLQHGLLQGGDCWVLNPPGQSLGFVLADAGYDVWIANGRGTQWSRHNEYYSVNEKEFWDWSWDELAAYDLPAVLTFVYNTTASQLFYVGHSQGTIIGLAALTQPKVIDMVAAAALLSPITYLDHITSKFLHRAASMYIDKLVKTMGLQEFNLRNNIGVEFVDLVCASEDVDCGNLLTAITGPNCCFNNSRIPYYLQYEPQSTSLKNMQHLAQNENENNLGVAKFFKHQWFVQGLLQSSTMDFLAMCGITSHHLLHLMIFSIFRSHLRCGWHLEEMIICQIQRILNTQSVR